jgi:hypothetical protein
MPATLSRSRLTSDQYFDAVIDAALSARARETTHHLQVAGNRVRLCFSGPALEASLFPALRHLESSEERTGGLNVSVWTSSGAELLLDHAPWPARDYWKNGKILSVRGKRGYVAFDRQCATISLHDHKTGAASLWTPAADALPFWVRGAPLLKILNWWLADHKLMLCHAAAVGTPDSAVLVVGRGGSGKSTVAISSLRSPLRYIGDDYVVVRGGDVPRVYSIYNSGKLAPGHMRRCFPGLVDHAHRSSHADCDKNLLFLADSHPQKLLSQASLKAIFVPRISGQAQPVIEEISSAEALRAIGPSTVFQLPGNKREKFAMLSRFTQQLPTYQICLSKDVERNIGLIRRFLCE